MAKVYCSRCSCYIRDDPQFADDLRLLSLCTDCGRWKKEHKNGVPPPKKPPPKKEDIQ